MVLCIRYINVHTCNAFVWSSAASLVISYVIWWEETLPFLSPQYATRSFSDMNTNPAPEHTWSLSSKEVKALSHASGSDYVYALIEDEVSVNMDS